MNPIVDGKPLIHVSKANTKYDVNRTFLVLTDYLSDTTSLCMGGKYNILYMYGMDNKCGEFDHAKVTCKECAALSLDLFVTYGIGGQ